MSSVIISIFYALILTSSLFPVISELLSHAVHAGHDNSSSVASFFSTAVIVFCLEFGRYP
ncbi:hypothetical protein DL96DRAFT_1630188 [Flagelloscypha sp. PMI_526]|nr:hypothetical protein DL96DRAFT_1630188 [Flagelloscypha sp. PMI_526]